MGTVPTDRVSKVLFGATRREVLSLLFGRPSDRFYLREIVRRTQSGSGAVQRELKQLVDAGLVNREAHGHQVYFTANSEAPIFSELRSIVEKTAGTADVLRVTLAQLVRKQRVEVAFVYGSTARGNQTSRSDVDLFIVGDAALTEIVTALRPVEERLGREVNPSLYTTQEFREKVRRRAPFVRGVLSGPKIFVAGDDRDLVRLAR